MKCPHCEKTMSVPNGRSAHISGVPIVVLYCPFCQAILGAVSQPAR